jgi:hypothetical protein
MFASQKWSQRVILRTSSLVYAVTTVFWHSTLHTALKSAEAEPHPIVSYNRKNLCYRLPNFQQIQCDTTKAWQKTAQAPTTLSASLFPRPSLVSPISVSTIMSITMHYVAIFVSCWRTYTHPPALHPVTDALRLFNSNLTSTLNFGITTLQKLRKFRCRKNGFKTRMEKRFTTMN